MVKLGRFEKTPERNYSDLDDHLYFLKEDLARLMDGDGAYAKKIAAELRTLVCLSSGTEGLLWRVVELLSADDRVELHAVKGVDRRNPLSAGLAYLMIPVYLGGQAPKGCPFAKKSIPLKVFLKEYPAIYHDGTELTHEKLIAAIAQQIGLSHESEDVAPVLIDLSGMAVSDRPTLVEFLIFDALLVLEVGERVLGSSVGQAGFSRKERPPIKFPTRRMKAFNFRKDDHFFCLPAQADNEGTQFWVVAKPHPLWIVDGRFYDFGSVQLAEIKVSAVKYSDGIVEVRVRGLTADPVTKRKMPTTDTFPHIAFAVTWKDGVVQIYINGEL